MHECFGPPVGTISEYYRHFFIVQVRVRVMQSNLVDNMHFGGLLDSNPVYIIEHSNVMIPKVETVGISVTDPATVFRLVFFHAPLG